MTQSVELTGQLEPRRVQYRALGELCTVFNGYAFKSDFFNTDGVGLPIIRIRDVNTGLSDTYFSGEFDERWLVNDGDILIGMDGDFRVNTWRHGRALLNQRVCRLQDLSPELLPGFLYYVVQDELDRIHSSITGSTVKHLSSRELERSRIPVPSLEVQREIVRILDQFTQVQAELDAELDAEISSRRSQYEYFRAHLLSVGTAQQGNVRVGDVATVRYGSDFPRRLQGNSTGEIPFFKVIDMTRPGNEVVMTTASNYVSAEELAQVGAGVAEAGTILLPRVGAAVGTNRKRVLGVQAAFDTSFLALTPGDGVLPHYMLHALSPIDLLSLSNTGAALPSVRRTALEDVVIPLPTPEDQRRVVDLLGELHARESELNVELSAERTARREQLVYYRNKLLTFTELAE